MSQVYAIVRLRGRVGVNYHAKKTLDLLRLRRVNH
ncbi:MAG: uL30 family ribosomal protein, partial [Candidatus Heimdallarchaeota archaeon]|nr:uL30 family ribosomal protein [Candidatus Heimdallarchaeota archaeon]